MQSPGSGPQSFQLVRRAHQAESYEIWDGQSSTSQPAAMVLLPPAVANNPAARAAFGATVAWAQRPDNLSVAVLSHDVIGPTPWIAILPDSHGRAVWNFLQQLQASSMSGPAAGAQPGYGYGPAPAAAPQPGYGAQPGYGPAPGHGPQRGYGWQPGYGSQPTVTPTPPEPDEQAPTT